MTAQKTHSPTPTSPADLARDWTARGWPCSRQYADKCLKSGCPTDSFDVAFAWRTARTGQRNTGKGEGGRAQNSAPPPTARAEPPAEILGDSLDAVLARARQAEREQYRTYLAAVTSGDMNLQSIALKAHKEAQKNLIEVEGMVFEAKKTRGEFVSLPAAQQRIDDRLAPLKAARQHLPRLLALALFPDSPARAMARIEVELCRGLDPAVTNAAERLIDPALAAAAAPAAA
jgi:hypothetical protein